MSVVGRSVGDVAASRHYQPVSQTNPTTGAPSGSGATSDGSTPVAGGNGTSASSTTNPVAVSSVGPTNVTRIVSAAASTNATSAKASAGTLYRVTGYNANAAARYFKLYNKASGPTVGTDTPVWTEYLPAQSRFEIALPSGLYFGTGIAFSLTTGVADADTGALTAADVLALNVAYR